MNRDVEQHIKKNCQWANLPANIKQALASDEKEYDKAVVEYSVKNQLRYKGNLVRLVHKDQRRYYEELLQYSRAHLMLYPYHLSDVMAKGLRITPFSYYIDMMKDIMTQERSYDTLPNFTAADCLQLLGIGRNQYIELMNQSRSNKLVGKLFRRKPIKDLLPPLPIEATQVETWWLVSISFITEDDVRNCKPPEKFMIDLLIDKGPQKAGTLDRSTMQSLYRRGLVYLEVPIRSEDCVTVPPLEGFVMNRVTGDYFETLLYKIFVSIDEHTSVAELAAVLDIDTQQVKNAVSLYCRLGFAKLKSRSAEPPAEQVHASWMTAAAAGASDKKKLPGDLLINWEDFETHESDSQTDGAESPTPTPLPWIGESSHLLELPAQSAKLSEAELGQAAGQGASGDGAAAAAATLVANGSGPVKRIAFIFDSTLTAFLMMGNLSPGLKNHAVTMFEVGKLCDETMDSFLSELDKVVSSDAEGEVQRYFEHASTLLHTIRFLRRNPLPSMGQGSGLPLDLVRCESLLALESASCQRLLSKNYEVLISMAPMSNETSAIISFKSPSYFGPAIPEVSSIWFKLYLYAAVGSGPPSMLLAKGSKLRHLPSVFWYCDRVLVTTWGHDPTVLPASCLLLTLSDILTHSAVLVQVYDYRGGGLYEDKHVAFPLGNDSSNDSALATVRKLGSKVDLEHTCGYVTLQRFCAADRDRRSSCAASVHSLDGGVGGAEADLLHQLSLETDVTAALTDNRVATAGGSPWVVLDCAFGIPLFSTSLNALVCSRVTELELLDDKSLTLLDESNQKLAKELIAFILEYQPDMTAMTTTSPSSSSSSCSLLDSSTATISLPSLSKLGVVPVPTNSLLFDGSRLVMLDDAPPG